MGKLHHIKKQLKKEIGDGKWAKGPPKHAEISRHRKTKYQVRLLYSSWWNTNSYTNYLNKIYNEIYDDIAHSDNGATDKPKD